MIFPNAWEYAKKRRKNMDFLNDYLVLVVVGICLCVGWVIKHLVPGEKINRFIPLMMSLLGVALNVWGNKAITPEVILGGLVSGLASTGMHQLLTQFIERGE